MTITKPARGRLDGRLYNSRVSGDFIGLDDGSASGAIEAESATFADAGDNDDTGRDPFDDDRLDGEPFAVGAFDNDRFEGDSLDQEPRILDRSEHSVSRKAIAASAVKVLYRLHRAGHKGYLVGGGVRDLLLGRRPKDFDICTDARPGEIRRLFRNARIIGRRFRLAHIIFQDGVVEVATFRRAPDPEDQRGGPEDLLITSDNTFGTPREDAFRRDFTINALFYNIGDFTVIDYVGGIDDLQAKLVRVIGDPDVRFREDPVRMMRACEFAGRLGFTIEKATQEGIERNREELRKAAPPRLTEELLELLKSGRAGASVQWMLELGVLEVLLPEALAMVRAAEVGAGEFGNVLPVLDAMSREDEEIPDAVLLAAVLLPQVMLVRYEREMKRRRWLDPGEFHEVVLATAEPFFDRYAVPNLKKTQLIQALEGFHRLCEGGFSRSQRQRFAGKSYFDHALMLFELLVRATGEGHSELEQWQAAARQRRRREPRLEVRRPRPRRRRR